MHSHETCEQLMAVAARTGNTGRLEYLAARCDRVHGDLTTTAAHRDGHETTNDQRSA